MKIIVVEKGAELVDHFSSSLPKNSQNTSVENVPKNAKKPLDISFPSKKGLNNRKPSHATVL
jgi:hypothetical protein